jgi:hypothetical protein
LLKITLVIPQRVRTDIALVSQVLEELFEIVVEHKGVSYAFRRDFQQMLLRIPVLSVV